jgi:tetratricopeptide (TPR) repeat protein
VARQIDLLPTLLDCLALPVPDGLDGRSLIRDEEDEREVYVEALLGHEEYGWSPVYGLVRDRWKYVHAPRAELYDLRTDPREETNLLSAEPQRSESMRRALQRYVDVGIQSAGAPPRDPGHDQALSALGYVAGGGLALPGEGLPDPKDMLDVAEKLSRAKSKLVSGPARDPLAAFVLLEEVLRVNPANGDALSWLGREAWREAAQNPGHPKREAYVEHSRRAFERMRERAPDRPEGEFGLGLLAALRNDHEREIAHYERALALDPRHVESLSNLMRIRHLRGEWARAIELSARILALDESNREACKYGGLSHFRAGGHLAAIQLLTRLVPARDPAEHNGLHFVLGECYRNSGNPEQALAHYARMREPDRTAQGVPALEAQCREALAAGR